MLSTYCLRDIEVTDEYFQTFAINIPFSALHSKDVRRTLDILDAEMHSSGS